jgi:hypothetical protein
LLSKINDLDDEIFEAFNIFGETDDVVTLMNTLISLSYIPNVQSTGSSINHDVPNSIAEDDRRMVEMVKFVDYLASIGQIMLEVRFLTVTWRSFKNLGANILFYCRRNKSFID